MKKKGFCLVLVLVLVLTSLPVLAFDGSSSNGLFKDLEKNFWAYPAIKAMVENNILSGYPDGTFRPNQAVTRAEFAKLMVKALHLPTDKDAVSSFIDITNKHWVVPYVEAAKPYLTGYQTTLGIKFKPDEPAQREDMAVALVRALQYDLVSESILEDYSDANTISKNLRPYVATAIEKGLMQGSVDASGKKVFKALAAITRAEAAQLLTNVIQEEKIIFDEEKVIIDDSGDFLVKAVVSGQTIVLNWDIQDKEGLEGFKIVASKTNPNPRYPENGYQAYVGADKRQHVIDHSSYNGSEFSQFKAGEKYYFSITAIYKDKKVAGNSVLLTYPNQGQVIHLPSALTVVKDGAYLKLSWTPSQSSDFKYYKVVASKKSDSPSYPDHGYMTAISKASSVTAKVQAGSGYNGGDIGSFEAGEDYYFAVTTVYHDGTRQTSNVVKMSIPLSTRSAINETFTLSGVAKDGFVRLEWNESQSDQFQGYKVVVSKSDTSPLYPENGYYRFITNRSQDDVDIPLNASYQNGDFEKFVAGQKLYYAITVLYKDGTKKTSNTIQLTMLP